MAGALHDAEKLGVAALGCAGRSTFTTWVTFFIGVLALFWLFSSGDFSFMLTLSSLISTFSFVLVLAKVEARRSARGLSSRMMECYSLVFAARLCATVSFEGYLPFDKSGDWLYQACEGVALCGSLLAVYLCRVRHARGYNAAHDALHSLWLVVPAAAAALLIHPHLNRHAPSDVAWAFALYLESVAVLCQFTLFMREGRAQHHTAHFLAAQALAKFLSFVFWSSTFAELSTSGHTETNYFVAVWVVGIQMVQLLIMVDFIHNYLYCVWCGIPVSRVACCSENNV